MNTTSMWAGFEIKSGVPHLTDFISPVIGNLNSLLLANNYKRVLIDVWVKIN